MRIHTLAGALALLSVTTAAPAQTARQCVTATEAEGLVLFAMPDIVRAVGATCTNALPATALLRRPQPVIAKFAAQGDAAWPAARAAMGKIGGPDARNLLEGSLGRPLLGSMIGPIVASEVRPADCVAINRIVELSQPLSARNSASLFVTILQLAVSRDEQVRRRLPLCPLTR